jgi:hypothetical protein
MAGGADHGEDATLRPSWRWAGAGLLGLASLWFLIQVAVGLAEEERLAADGVEVLAEVVRVDPNRSITGYEDVVVAFRTEDGEQVRTTIEVQDATSGGITRVRYDPDDPSAARSVDDPATLWLEDAALAVVVGVCAVLLFLAPRIRRWRDAL